MNTFKVLLAAGAVSLMGGASFAATADIFESDGNCTVGDISPTADACYGVVDGNDGTNPDGTNPQANFNTDIFNGDTVNGEATGVDNVDVGLWGITSWEFLGKRDNNGTTVDSSGIIYELGDQPNAWSFAGDLSDFDIVAYVFKQSSGFSVYGYGDGNLPGSGTYSLMSLFGKDDLSHLSVYGVRCDDDRGDDDDCGGGGTVVPLPAAGWLLLGGLGGLAALRRRKTA